MLYLASDHRGFGLKEKVKEFLNTVKIEYKDFGNLVYDKDDDLPDFASKVAKKISQNSKKDKGIVICGSGVGGSIISNKFKKVRAALCLTVNVAKESREHHDSNVLCLAADLTDSSVAWMIIKK
ncbi:MAG TPA: RpiB/LacA/LacB family sugar-phosphate isomerase [Candidatus Paceibacterota bacterium]|jgi:ribose 5-phosphate isomerase B|nr:RpiB/LacA/LacB family sugar-phosphate isomerase [Candidatus Paceibacterota bacterium]HRZ29390.1 RpiB/LacA/LacB family sugar-phosphate isomerase [Candidatus Paceibacterota bacterium]